MLDHLVSQFMASGAATDTVNQVAQRANLSEGQARQAVETTAQGAAQAAGQEGGLASMAGSLLGGGGLDALAGSLLGGGQGQAPSNGVPPQLAQTVAQMVAQRTGLSPAIATTVVNLALPKIMEFIRPG